MSDMDPKSAMWDQKGKKKMNPFYLDQLSAA